MKTRELMRCDIRIFSDRIRKLKSKELRRHIERVAADLGEKDVDAMMEDLINTIFDEDGMPQTTSEEMDRVMSVLERRVTISEDNVDAVMRLMALQMAYIRRGVRGAAREQRLADHRGEQDHHHCDDPGCTDHEHHH